MMVSDLKKELKRVRNSKEFKSYIKDHKDSYLTSCFMDFDDIKEAKWKINFYDPKKDRMTIFSCEKEINVKGPEKILKKDKSKIDRLDLKKVKINLNEAMEKIEKFKGKKYSNELTQKTILILQSLKKKTIWNFSYLTSTAKILNIRIDAFSGKILSHRVESIIDLKAH